MAGKLEFIYASALSLKRPRVAHAKGNPKMGKAFTVCGHPLGDLMGKIERGGARRCEQCFVQGTAKTMKKEAERIFNALDVPLPAEPKKKERAVYPGLLVQNSRHVRRQLERFAEKYPNFGVWALQQARYIKAGLDEIGAGE